MTDLRERFLNLLFPEPVGCLVCGNPDAEDILCADCKSTLYKNGPLCCEVCGRTIYTGTRCRVCETHDWKSVCGGVEILYRYDGTVRHAIRSAKFYSNRKAALAMAHLIVRRIHEMDTPPDTIACVPSHFLRVWLRGYSSMGFIARRVSRMTGIPFESRALVRVRGGAPLARASHEKRAQLVQGAFARGKLKRTPERLLLLDDVCTSGSTLWECLSTLGLGDTVQALVLSGPEESSLAQTGKM